MTQTESDAPSTQVQLQETPPEVLQSPVPIQDVIANEVQKFLNQSNLNIQKAQQELLELQIQKEKVMLEREQVQLDKEKHLAKLQLEKEKYQVEREKTLLGVLLEHQRPAPN